MFVCVSSPDRAVETVIMLPMWRPACSIGCRHQLQEHPQRRPARRPETVRVYESLRETEDDADAFSFTQCGCYMITETGVVFTSWRCIPNATKPHHTQKRLFLCDHLIVNVSKGNQSEVSGLHLLHRRHVLIYYLINQLWHKTPCCYIIELHLHSWFHFCCQVLPVRTICSNARFHPFLFESGKHPLGLFMQTTELNAP